MKLSLIAVLGTAALAQQATAQQLRTANSDVDVKFQSAAPVIQALPPAPVAGSDLCTTPEVIPAPGLIAYTNVGATTGPEGQVTLLGGECGNGCAQYGNPQSAILKDVWFSFTPATSGRIRISDCGIAGANDIKIAVYDIPCASILNTCVACNDDYHNGVSGLLDAGVIFSATASTTYLIQVGNSSFAAAATTSTGTFNLEYVDFVTTGVWDNGAFWNSLALTNAGDGAMMMQGFKAPPGVVTVTGAEVLYQAATIPANTPITIAIYDDPTDDQDPADCVLLDSTTGLANPSGVSVPYTFTSPVPVTGDYFIAITQIDVLGADFPWAISGESCAEHPNSSWVGTRTGAAWDIGTVGNPIPTVGQTNLRLGSFCGNSTTLRHSVLSIRANQVIAPTDTPFTVYCSGDGTDTACPCTNPGVAGRGCENTVGSGGAQLSSTGIASVSADTLVMHGAFAVPFGPGLYYEGNARPAASAPFGIPFGNGLRCAAGATNRLEIRFADNTGASNTTVSLQAFGAALSGTTYHYQLWYRDTGNVGSCTPGAGFNLSNAISLTWGP